MKKEILHDRIIIYQKSIDMKTIVLNVTSISEIGGIFTITGEDMLGNRATFRLSEGEIVYTENQHGHEAEQ